MRISPIILFSVDFIIYAIFGEDLSQDLSARLFDFVVACWPVAVVHFFQQGRGIEI